VAKRWKHRVPGHRPRGRLDILCPGGMNQSQEPVRRPRRRRRPVKKPVPSPWYRARLEAALEWLRTG
jgi:hypothetical protein